VEVVGLVMNYRLASETKLISSVYHLLVGILLLSPFVILESIADCCSALCYENYFLDDNSTMVYSLLSYYYIVLLFVSIFYFSNKICFDTLCIVLLAPGKFFIKTFLFLRKISPGSEKKNFILKNLPGICNNRIRSLKICMIIS
jgi:hypothetical protein